jgi:hypothetical protein
MLSTEPRVAALPTKGYNMETVFVKEPVTSQLSLLKTPEGIA